MVPVAYVQSNQLQYKCSNNHYHNSVVFQTTSQELLQSEFHPLENVVRNLFCGLFDNHSIT